MELVAPIGPWLDMEEVVVTVRKGFAMVVGRRGEDYVERLIDVGEVPEKVLRVAEAYDEFLHSFAKAIGSNYEPQKVSDVSEWLDRHGKALERLNSEWGRVIDKVGPFSVDASLSEVYIPYIGMSATATYLVTPYRDARVRAENRGRSMAIGSVEVLWQDSTVVKVGIRTVSGAVILSQASPSLHPSLEKIRDALAGLVETIKGIVQSNA